MSWRKLVRVVRKYGLIHQRITLIEPRDKSRADSRPRVRRLRLISEAFVRTILDRDVTQIMHELKLCAIYRVRQ